MVANLQAQINWADPATSNSLLGRLVNDRSFFDLGMADKVSYLQQEFLPKVSPEFNDLNPSERSAYVRQVVMPHIDLMNQTRPKDVGQIVQMPLAYAGAAAQNITEPFISGMTFGAADAASKAITGMDIEQSGIAANQRLEGQLGIPQGALTDVAANPWARIPSWLAGGIGSGAILEGGIAKGIGAMAPKVFGNTAAFNASPLRQALFKGLYNNLGQPTALSRILGSGIAGAAIGGVDAASRGFVDGQNPMQIAQSAATQAAFGGALGVALPPALGAVARGLGGVARAVGENVPTFQAGIRKDASIGLSGFTNALDDGFGAIRDQLGTITGELQGIAEQIRNGAMQASDDEIVNLAKILSESTAYLNSANPVEPQPLLNAANQFMRRLRLTGRAPSNLYAQYRGVPQADIPQASGLTGADLEARLVEEKRLNDEIGSISQELQNTPKKSEQESLLKARLKVLKTRKSEIAKETEIGNPNEKTVLKAKLETGREGLQMPVDPEKQLTLEGVVSILKNPKEKNIAKQLWDAMQRDVKVRLKYIAEISGRTDKNVKLTKAGNITPEATDFSPLYFAKVKKVVKTGTDEPLMRTITKGERAGQLETAKPSSSEAKKAIEAGEAELKEYVAVSGHGENGHLRTYYLSQSPEGSVIAQVTKLTDKPAFRGTIPNRALGQREYNPQDVLNLAPDERVGIKTSEAKRLLEIAKKLLDEQTIQRFSPKAQKILLQIKKKGSLAKADLIELQKALKGLDADLQVFCGILEI